MSVEVWQIGRYHPLRFIAFGVTRALVDAKIKLRLRVDHDGKLSKMQPNAISILGYGCTTAAGSTTADFWRGLVEGKDHSAESHVNRQQACLWPDRHEGSARQILLHQMMQAWKQASPIVDRKSRVGVVFASTKGLIDDVVWHKDQNPVRQDTFTELLGEFIRQSELNPIRVITVSNACASSLSALFVARQWLNSNAVDQVVVVAADCVGPFVINGFHCLRALTDDQVRPFAKNRSGLRLGEAAAVMVLARSSQEDGQWRLEGVGLDSQGVSVTRPVSQSLKQACQRIAALKTKSPDLIIAHGTATPINDPIEDEIFFDLFGRGPIVTATKWSVGHTLGASGALDVIAACEALAKQTVFKIANTLEVDPAFRSRYLTKNTNERTAHLDRVLVTSLGFGGIHAAALISRVGAL